MSSGLERRIQQTVELKAAAFENIVTAMRQNLDDPTKTVNQACRAIVRQIQAEVREMRKGKR